jgi:hypothetical protein
MFLVVLGGIVAARICHGRAGAYWLGFAIFSAVFFVFTLLIGDFWVVGNVLLGIESEPPRPSFVTSYLLAWAFDYFCTTGMESASGEAVSGLEHLRALQESRVPGTVDDSTFAAFVSTGHCIFTVLVGLLGGWLGSWFYRHDGTARSSDA